MLIKSSLKLVGFVLSFTMIVNADAPKKITVKFRNESHSEAGRLVQDITLGECHPVPEPNVKGIKGSLLTTAIGLDDRVNYYCRLSTTQKCDWNAKKPENATEPFNVGYSHPDDNFVYKSFLCMDSTDKDYKHALGL